MISLREIELYLPKYLSPEKEDDLFRELNNFPYNIDSRLYIRSLLVSDTLFQGDGIHGLEFCSLPNTTISAIDCMILSNTCDIDPSNARFFPPAICYAPIISIERYKHLLQEEGIDEMRIMGHVESIKRQKLTGMFFLPKGARLETDCVVFLDKICHYASDLLDRQTIPTRKLFVLSDYGFYLFLLKLSIHFTRM
jgi:hypothetical protein